MGASGLPLLHALGWMLLHFCWQGAAVALLLWCGLGVLPARWSRARYGAACAALALMVALPLATFARLAKDELAARRAFALPVISIDVAVSAGGAGATPVPLQERVREALDRSVPWLPVVWLAGVMVFLARLNAGLLEARRMRSAGTEAAAPELLRAFEAVKVRLGVARAVRLAQSALVQVPTVVSWLRPVVLLPVGCFLGLSQMQVEALLAHELAHIRRHDYLVSVLQSVVETLLFYHPAVWWVSRQVRRERECCCDDLAVEVAGDKLAYARALSWLEERRAAMPEMVLGANGGVLKMRIKRLLGLRVCSAGSQFAAFALLAVVVAVAGSYVVAVARAQRTVVQPAVGLHDAAVASVTETAGSVTLLAAEQPAKLMIAMEPPAATGGKDTAGLAPVYRNWVNEDVVWIIGPEERDAFLRLANDEERDKFIEQFWERRNPVPGSLGNSFKDEHYARIAYANEHFGHATELPGWKTDRGHIYIAYGKPDDIDAHPNGDAKQSYPFEVWHYGHVAGVGEDVTLMFVDTCRCGLYTYTIDRVTQAEQGYREHTKAVHAEEEYRLMLQQFPDSPHMVEAAQRLREVQAKLASYAAPAVANASAGSARLVAAASAPASAAQAAAGTAQGGGAIEGSVMDKTGAVVARAKLTATNTDTGVQMVRETDGSGKYTFSQLPVGNYNVEVEAKGFMRLLQENVRVDGKQAVGLNMKLSVGGEEMTATVIAPPMAAAAPVPPAPPPSTDGSKPVGPLRVSSGTMMGALISKVDPVYPAAAKAKRVQGAVVLHAVISKTGTIKDLTAVSGPMELVVAAAEAVQQWEYMPYLLNGEPTEVETTITVNFSMAESAEAPKPEGSHADVAPKRLGPGITPPLVIYKADPEFSEEARKAHVSGAVQVGLWVDEQGNPTHVHVVRGVGVGPDGQLDPKYSKANTDALNDKAVAAVKQYRFKPAIEDGKPVAVQVNIEVNFQIF
jgi:TonB family protein